MTENFKRINIYPYGQMNNGMSKELVILYGRILKAGYQVTAIILPNERFCSYMVKIKLNGHETYVRLFPNEE